jgi:serine phosphatase RsbU (regulator of sigma subunit)
MQDLTRVGPWPETTAAIALENAYRCQNPSVQDPAQVELLCARKVQEAFLPRRRPDVPGYQFYACYEPAHSVGGDYIGCIELPDARLAMGIGDVSGKGMPAALLMAYLASDIRAFAISDSNPQAVLNSVNQSLSEVALADAFITLTFMVLDVKRHALTLANAGHPPPLLRRASGEIEEVGAEKAGPPLNVNLRIKPVYQPVTLLLEPGDLLLAFTDGITEAQNRTGDFFGSEQLQTALRQAPAAAADAGAHMLATVRRFTAGQPQHDDMTFACFGRQIA